MSLPYHRRKTPAGGILRVNYCKVQKCSDWIGWVQRRARATLPGYCRWSGIHLER